MAMTPSVKHRLQPRGSQYRPGFDACNAAIAPSRATARILSREVRRKPEETVEQGSTCGVHDELFVIIDIDSRYVIAWTVAAAGTGEFVAATLQLQRAESG